MTLIVTIRIQLIPKILRKDRKSSSKDSTKSRVKPFVPSRHSEETKDITVHPSAISRGNVRVSFGMWTQRIHICNFLVGKHVDCKSMKWFIFLCFNSSCCILVILSKTRVMVSFPLHLVPPLPSNTRKSTGEMSEKQIKENTTKLWRITNA